MDLRTREDLDVEYSVKEVDSGEVLAAGKGLARADRVTTLGRIPFSAGWQRFYLLPWTSPLGNGVHHYLAGYPPFSLPQYRAWLEKADL